MGSVRVALNELELSTTASPIEVWGEIARERKPPEEIQEVLISLSYLPQAERLTLNVLKARNLILGQGKQSVSPFVKVSLICGKKKKKKGKTKTIKNSRCPVWNESMHFDIPTTAIDSSAIEVRKYFYNLNTKF